MNLLGSGFKLVAYSIEHMEKYEKIWKYMNSRPLLSPYSKYDVLLILVRKNMGRALSDLNPITFSTNDYYKNKKSTVIFIIFFDS